MLLATLMSKSNTHLTLHLPANYLHTVQSILKSHVPQAQVWAYGSRVNGDHYDASDLDLVVRNPTDLTIAQSNLGEVREAFSNSDLPILVQLVDWATIPKSFREEIEAAYFVLQG